MKSHAYNLLKKLILIWIFKARVKFEKGSLALFKALEGYYHSLITYTVCLI